MESLPVILKDESVDTQLVSAKARSLGRAAYQKYSTYDSHECFCQITEDDVIASGGRKRFIEVFVYFYKLLQSDPIMRVLFDKVLI